MNPVIFLLIIILVLVGLKFIFPLLAGIIGIITGIFSGVIGIIIGVFSAVIGVIMAVLSPLFIFILPIVIIILLLSRGKRKSGPV